jgi:5-methyltetrahydrofolate--homocysteine methyltransferase
VSRDVPIPQAPFYGSRVVENISLADLFSFINETALFKGQWQFKQGRMPLEEYQALVREKVRPIYQELKKRSAQEKLLVPKVVYGYYQCQSEGNDLIVYDREREVRFTFPRQPAGKHLCLADFFAARESGRMDTVAFHLVTVGRRASVYSHELFKSDNYSDYLYFHGLSVESAEALAELWHSVFVRNWVLRARIRRICHDCSGRITRARVIVLVIRRAHDSKIRRSFSRCSIRRASTWS